MIFKLLFVHILLWYLALFGQVFFNNLFPFSFQFLFILVILFTVWRHPAMHFVALFYGLTQDSISNTIFGVYGLVFFSYSFLGQWLEGKLWQKTVSSMLLLSFLGLMSMDFMASLLASILERRWFFLHYLDWQIWLQMLLTSLLIVPCHTLFKKFMPNMPDNLKKIE